MTPSAIIIFTWILLVIWVLYTVMSDGGPRRK